MASVPWAAEADAERAGAEVVGEPEGSGPAEEGEALFRTRTGDPLLTMEVLYQLS